MNKHSLVVYSKDKHGWNINSTGPIKLNVIGLTTKEHAKYIWSIMKVVYNKGRDDEFEENNNKTNTLMERFGL